MYRVRSSSTFAFRLSATLWSSHSCSRPPAAPYWSGVLTDRLAEVAAAPEQRIHLRSPQAVGAVHVGCETSMAPTVVRMQSKDCANQDCSVATKSPSLIDSRLESRTLLLLVDQIVLCVAITTHPLRGVCKSFSGTDMAA